MNRILLILFFLPFISQAQIIFYDDCEASNKPIYVGTNGNVSNGWTSRQGSSTNSSVTRSTAYARKGSYSYRHVLSNSTNDGWQYMKAELAWNFLPAGSPLGTVGDNTSYYRQPLGLRWMAASTLIPSSNNDFNTMTSILFNTKPVEDDWPTPTYLAMEAGRYVFIITKLSVSGAATITKTDAGPVVKDQWEDWVMNRDFTSSTSGFVRLYKNGDLVAEYIGPNWKDDGLHSKEPYMQMGLYKWAFGNNHNPTPNVNTVEMYMDEVRFGTAAASLSDFIVDPEDIPNLKPTATISPATVTTGISSVTVIAQSADPDGSIPSKAWTYVSGPSTPSLVGTQGDTLRATLPLPGTYNFRYIVTDNDGASDTAFVAVIRQVGRGIIFSDNAEAVGSPQLGGANADITQYYTSRIGSTANVLERSSEQAREGFYSYKFTLKNVPTTGWQYCDNELTWNYIPSTTPIGLHWSGLSIFLPLINQGDNTPTTFGFNSLRYPDDGNKPDFMDVINGRWIFKHAKYTAGGSFTGYESVDVGPVAYGVWNDWAVQRNYSLSVDTSRIRLFLNKNQVYQFTGPNYNPSGARPEPYKHIGIWKLANDTAISPNKDSIVVYIDNITFADYAITDVGRISPNRSPQIRFDPQEPTNKDTITVLGNSTDDDGIETWTWTKLSGPSATMTGTNKDTLRAQLTTEGTYVFQLLVEDSLGAADAQTVTIIREVEYNDLPTLEVPDDLFLSNEFTAQLTAVGYDQQDTTAVNYSWWIENGPTAKLINANTATLTITDLKPGNYTIVCRVTDSQGAIAQKTVRLAHRNRRETYLLPPDTYLKIQGKQ